MAAAKKRATTARMKAKKVLAGDAMAMKLKRKREKKLEEFLEKDNKL